MFFEQGRTAQNGNRRRKVRLAVLRAAILALLFLMAVPEVSAAPETP